MEDTAFRAFFEATRSPLQAYLRRASGNDALAEDLLQESYLRFLDRPPRSEDDRSRRAYLFKLATNLLRDHWRRERPFSWIPWIRNDEGEDEGPAAPEPASDHPGPDRLAIGRQAVQRGFEALSPRQRSLLWLAHAEGFEHRELAKLFQVSEASVKVLLHRARAKMAQALQNLSLQDGVAS